MKLLELKIPPILLVIIFAILMFGISRFLPNAGLDYPIRLYFFLGTIVLDGCIVTLGVWSFKIANTTVNPTKPDSSTNLVQNGIYKYTRNPMYLGFAFFLFGLGFYFDSIFSISLVFAFVVYMTAFQIKPEERALSNKFGNQFQQYRILTRRWL